MNSFHNIEFDSFLYKRHRELPASPVFLAFVAHGEAGVFVEDVEATGEQDFPSIVELYEAVVVCVECVGELHTVVLQFCGQVVEGVYHLGDAVVVVLCVQLDGDFLRQAAVAYGLYQFDEIVYLEPLTDVRVGDDDMCARRSMFSQLGR